MATLDAIAAGMADTLAGVDIANIQVTPFRWFAATPPALDIYPADPAQEDEAFGPAQSLTLWMVRARVGTVDNEGQQKLLLKMMEPAGPTSVRGTLNESEELGGLVEGLYCERPSGYRLYDEIGITPPLMGVEWRVRVHNSSADVS